MPLYLKIDAIANMYHLTPSALPGPNHDTSIARIDTRGWPAEALAALARIAAKRFAPWGYYYEPCGAVNQFAGARELCAAY